MQLTPVSAVLLIPNMSQLVAQKQLSFTKGMLVTEVNGLIWGKYIHLLKLSPWKALDPRFTSLGKLML